MSNLKIIKVYVDVVWMNVLVNKMKKESEKIILGGSQQSIYGGCSIWRGPISFLIQSWTLSSINSAAEGGVSFGSC